MALNRLQRRPGSRVNRRADGIPGPVRVLVMVLALVLSWPVGADTGLPRDGQRWLVTALAGLHDDSRFLEILQLDGGDVGSSYLGGGAVGRELGYWGRSAVWEGEAQLYRHWGEQSLWEGSLAVALRWTRFPWDGLVDTSIAFGQGVSVASERPPVEGDTRRLLHHMHVDLEFRPPSSRHLSLVGRLHHRSGVFGLYGVSGGSNFLTLGLRYRF